METEETMENIYMLVIIIDTFGIDRYLWRGSSNILNLFKPPLENTCLVFIHYSGMGLLSLIEELSFAIWCEVISYLTLIAWMIFHNFPNAAYALIFELNYVFID